jgi:hypothetical protein
VVANFQSRNQDAPGFRDVVAGSPARPEQIRILPESYGADLQRAAAGKQLASDQANSLQNRSPKISQEQSGTLDVAATPSAD